MKILCVAIVCLICTISESNSEATENITISDGAFTSIENWKEDESQFTLLYLENNVINSINVSTITNLINVLNEHNCLFSYCHHRYDCKGKHLAEDVSFYWCVKGKDEIIKNITEKVIPVIEKQWGNLVKQTLLVYGNMGADKPVVDKALCENRKE